jgi:lysophospholipase L1-like esterase
VGPRATQHRAFSENLRAFVESRNFHFYDAYPVISEASARGEKLYFTGDMHFNRRGFEVWSEGFARDLGEWVRRSVR